jgi:NCS1 family nucleobase:cation symporter-1
MGPLAGIMVCDYYIIRKRKLDVRQLYQAHGIYWYSHGFNWRAFVAFFVAVGPLMPGFAKSIAHNLNVGGAWKLFAFAWIYGFVNSVFVYYVICKWISPMTESLVEEAVYPPGKEGFATPTEGTVIQTDTKEMLIHEKETDSPV